MQERGVRETLNVGETELPEALAFHDELTNGVVAEAAVVEHHFLQKRAVKSEFRQDRIEGNVQTRQVQRSEISTASGERDQSVWEEFCGEGEKWEKNRPPRKTMV